MILLQTTDVARIFMFKANSVLQYVTFFCNILYVQYELICKSDLILIYICICMYMVNRTPITQFMKYNKMITIFNSGKKVANAFTTMTEITHLLDHVY